MKKPLKKCTPDFSLMYKSGYKIIITAPGKNADFVSRFFAPVAGINEDPVTGSAHSQLIPFWSEKLNKQKLFALQLSQRGGKIWCLLNVKGEELAKVRHYYKDPHFYAFQKVLVVGAANSAVDAALETWRKGAEVTMVIRNNTISERVKYWVKPDIENRITEGSIKAYFNSSVADIRENEVDIKTTDGLVTIKNDWVLAMTGYQPDLNFLRKLGIKLSADEVCKPFYNEETYESNVKGIYLAGVICGGMNTHRLFIENSREHAEKIVKHVKQKTAEMKLN